MQSLTKVIFLLIGWLTLSLVHAQKVDLDRFSFDSSYVTFPKEYVDPQYRTFGVRVNVRTLGMEADIQREVYDAINVFGYRRVEADPTVGVVVNFNDLRFENSTMQTRTEEKKDKDGKVTSRTTYYKLAAVFSMGGGYTIYGPKTGEPIKREKPKEEKTNRFLQNVSQSNEGFTGSSTGSSFPLTINFTTNEFNSAQAAERYFQENRNSIRRDLVRKYVSDAIGTVNQRVNTLYGYTPVQTKDFLWILDSKSHPEYAIQQEAIQAVKQISKMMSASRPLDELAQSLQPVMEYFQTLKTKYNTEDKRDKKMRYSAYYNLSKLYLLLDQPEKAIDEANGLIKNDYDTADGERFIRDARELKADLEKHHMDSRHMASL